MTEKEDKKKSAVDVHALNKAANSLLDAVSDTQQSLAERTKAFDAVTDWLALRYKLAPPRKEPSKFERLRERNRAADRAAERRALTGQEENAPIELDDDDAEADDDS